MYPLHYILKVSEIEHWLGLFQLINISLSMR